MDTNATSSSDPSPVSILDGCELPNCAPDLGSVDEGVVAEIPAQEEVVDPPLDSGAESCGPESIMTINGCEECDQVISNVSQQITAYSNNHRVCESDSDCESIIPQTGCSGYCSFVIASNQKALFLEEIAQISNDNCSDPDLQTKCGYKTPGCGPVTSLCTGGLCELKPFIDCVEPNPEGCILDEDCSEGEVCSFKNEPCLSSSCLCDTTQGTWICTPDCAGECVPGTPEEGCEGENPQGCISTGCPDEQVCDQTQGSKPTSCHCSDVTDPPNWNCTKDNSGGICVPE